MPETPTEKVPTRPCGYCVNGTWTDTNNSPRRCYFCAGTGRVVDESVNEAAENLGAEIAAEAWNAGYESGRTTMLCEIVEGLRARPGHNDDLLIAAWIERKFS